MENKNLGEVKKIDLRKFWIREEEFTKWLAKEENLRRLGEEIGINIKLIQTEASAGDFSVDILAEEERTTKKIIIENQIEDSDHNHLGKLIAYASAHNAEFIIWIVKKTREEHEQAIDWLNNFTDETINFFVIEIELWQIEDSKIAPKFSIISKPNDWSKNIKRAIRAGELSDLAVRQLEFQNRFITFCKEKGSFLRLSKPQPGTPAYYYIPIGVAGVSIAVKLNTNKGVIKIDVYFLDKGLFNTLKEKNKEAIEKDFGDRLIWDDLPNYKGALVGTGFNFDINKESKWIEYFEQIKSITERLYKVFPYYIKKLN